RLDLLHGRRPPLRTVYKRPSSRMSNKMERLNCVTQDRAFVIFRAPASTSASPTLTYNTRTRLALPHERLPQPQQQTGRLIACMGNTPVRIVGQAIPCPFLEVCESRRIKASPGSCN